MRPGSLLVIVLALVAFGGIAAVAEDPLDRRLAKISPQAVDCGTTGEGAHNRAEVNACVREHLLNNRAFRARFASRCAASVCAMGIVLESPPGVAYLVHFDEKGCTAAKAKTLFCGTWVEPCRNPLLVPRGTGLKLVCKNEYAL